MSATMNKATVEHVEVPPTERNPALVDIEYG